MKALIFQDIQNLKLLLKFIFRILKTAFCWSLYYKIINKESVEETELVDSQGDNIDSQIQEDLNGYFKEKKEPEAQLRRYTDQL